MSRASFGVRPIIVNKLICHDSIIQVCVTTSSSQTAGVQRWPEDYLIPTHPPILIALQLHGQTDSSDLSTTAPPAATHQPHCAANSTTLSLPQTFRKHVPLPHPDQPQFLSASSTSRKNRHPPTVIRQSLSLYYRSGRQFPYQSVGRFVSHIPPTCFAPTSQSGWRELISYSPLELMF